MQVLYFLVYYFYSLAATIFLFLGGFAKARNRVLMMQIARHFGFSRRLVKPQLPRRRISDLEIEKELLQVREPQVEEGNVSLLEIVVIAKLIRKSRARRIFEIGTFDGRTTLNMAANAPDDGVVYTLDLPAEQLGSTAHTVERAERIYISKPVSGSRFMNSEYHGKIRQLYGDSGNFDFSPYVNSFDFVFIDGSHAYEYVLNDSRIAIRLLRDGKGIILWHDYDAWKGVTSALNELYESEDDFRGMVHIDGTSLVLLERV